jgi:hypothetical protein
VDRAVLGEGIIRWPGLDKAQVSGPDEFSAPTRCEALHPSEEGHVIHLDAPLSEQFLEIAIGQAVAQVPAHRARTMISGGNRKPLNAAFGTADTGRQRRELI